MELEIQAPHSVSQAVAEEIESLYRYARQFSTTDTIPHDAEIEHRDNMDQAKIVYRWLLNHARANRLELIQEFTKKTVSEETRKHILSLKNQYIKDKNRELRSDEFEKNGFTLLHVAVLFERPDVVRILLPDGNDPHELLMERTEPDGWLALHLCTTHVGIQGLQVVKFLLEAYKKKYDRVLHDPSSFYGREPETETSTLLLRFKGAFHDNRAMTPLHYATWASNHKVVRELLKQNPKEPNASYLGTITYVHSVDLFLLTPLHISALVLIRLKDGPLTGKPRSAKDTIQTAKLLIEAADTKHPDTSEAIEVSMLDICINAVDCCSYTPLHWAAHSDASEIVKLLLAQDKIKPLEKDRDKKTPLHVALESSRPGKGLLLELESSSTASKKLLLSNTVVKEDVDRRLKDRQISVDSSNATLVGASLVASVTFAAILQPPLGWVTYFTSTWRDVAPGPDAYRSYAAVGKDAGIQVFWILNCLSFLFATCTVISSSLAVRPKSERSHIRDLVMATKKWLVITSLLFTLSILFVLGAFFAAGIAALPPPLYLKVTSFILPGSIPLFFNVMLCIYLIFEFRDQISWFGKKSWKSVLDYAKNCRTKQGITTLKFRQESKGLVALVKLLTQSSDRFQISDIMEELEELRPAYHKDQSSEACRKEAIDVGGKALLDMLKPTQTPNDSWPSDALDPYKKPQVEHNRASKWWDSLRGMFTFLSCSCTK